MESEEIKDLFNRIKKDEISIDEGVEIFKELSYKDLGYAKIDTNRKERVGYPEVIYCEGKSIEQVRGIVEFLDTKENNILLTRARKDMYLAVKEMCTDAEFNEIARTITIRKKHISKVDSYIAIVTAGTSDLAVAEEAKVTAEILGNRAEIISDVGVAGIHRLFNELPRIKGAKVVIVVAGMEGALASVVSGLIDKPIIAVPTSVGYGASFNGLAALLSMLNSCASGVSVVNIDNGFGAGYIASMINKG